MLKVKLNGYSVASGVAMLTMAASSFAVIDVTSVTTAMSDGTTAVGTIGGAILGLWAIRKVYSLIAR